MIFSEFSTVFINKLIIFLKINIDIIKSFFKNTEIHVQEIYQQSKHSHIIMIFKY